MKTSTFAKDGLIRGLSVLGFKRTSLGLFDSLDSSTVSIPQFKRSIALAKQIGDNARQLQYIEAALETFPYNTFGYLEAASYWVSEGDAKRAWMILRKAPKSGQVNAAQAQLESKHLTAAEIMVLKSNLQKGEISSTPSKSKDATKRSVVTPKVADATSMKKVAASTSAVLNSQQVKELALKAGPLNSTQTKSVALRLDVLDSAELEVIAERTKHTLRSNPFTWATYDLQARIWVALKRHISSVRLLESMPKVITRGLSYQLLLAAAHEGNRDQISALRVMFAAQRNLPGERQLLLKIGDLYRADNQIHLAHIFFKAAQACYPIYGAARLLSFEADHGLLHDANKTLDRIAQFEAADLLKFMPILNRVSVFFPERRAEFAQWRDLARKTLWIRPFRSPTHLSKQLDIAIKCRWISDARRLVSQARKKGLKVPRAKVEWLNRVETSLGEMAELLEITYQNDQCDELFGLHDGVPMMLDPRKLDPDKTVEVFIPTVFFSDPEEEKPSYETVRSFLSSAYSTLLARKDLVIVPRHQYNWRDGRRRLEARALSYHTSAAPDPLWLHVQESPLAGRCSTDHQGFAGYSSLANDFSAIVQATEGITLEALQLNQQEMYEQYVNGNVSKYAQPEERRKISGKYVFVALQIPTDIVANLAWLKGETLLRAVADFYVNSDTQVIVKRHPYCTSMSIQAAVEELRDAQKIITSTDSVHDLIEGAQIVFTVNSGVGLEALMHLKPVIVTGDCDYRFGVTAAVKSVQELVEVLENPLPDASERALQLLYYYRCHYTFSATSKKECRKSVLTWLGISAQEQAKLDALEQAELEAIRQAELEQAELEAIRQAELEQAELEAIRQAELEQEELAAQNQVDMNALEKMKLDDLESSGATIVVLASDGEKIN